MARHFDLPRFVKRSMQEKVYGLNPSHRRKLPRTLKGSKKTVVLTLSLPNKSPSKSKIQLSTQQMEESKWRC